MALTFAHVECGYANVTTGGGVGLFGSLEWSETLGSAGACPRAVPSDAARANSVPSGAFAALRVSAGTGDIYVTQAAASPDATQASGVGATARAFVRAGTTETFFALPGSRVAVAAG